VLVEREFTVEYESQIPPRIFGTKCWTTKGREVERGGVKRSMGSGKMENFSLGMFDNKTKTVKEI